MILIFHTKYIFSLWTLITLGELEEAIEKWKEKMKEADDVMKVKHQYMNVKLKARILRERGAARHVTNYKLNNYLPIQTESIII